MAAISKADIGQALRKLPLDRSGTAADFGDVLARLEASESCRRDGASTPPAPFSGTPKTVQVAAGSAAA